MAELVTTGTWNVGHAKQAAFMGAWAAFAEWASAMPSAGTLRLGRDVGDVRRFVSYAASSIRTTRNHQRGEHEDGTEHW